MKMYILVLPALLGALELAAGAKILAFLPLPWRSHQFVFQGLIRGLAERGHQIDFYTPVPLTDPPPNLRQIKVIDRLKDATDVIDDEELMNAGPSGAVQIVYDVTMHMSLKMYGEEKVYKDLLQSNKQYDLVISEYPVYSEYTAYLAHKFKARSVVIMGFLDYPWTNEIAGLPDNPSYMISFQGRTTDRMTFLERLYNFYITASILRVCYYETITRQQPFADQYFTYDGWEGRPKLTEMISDVDLILVNSHFSMGYSYPKAPHVKDIGGIHLTPPKDLPTGLKEFMDKAPHGVIYFSLGSVVDATEMLKGGKIDIFLKVFRGLKQRVVWKTSPGMPIISGKNIMTQDWLPQQDILRHNNTVLFITHGGLQSTVETINYGVPIIGMPVFFDQFKDVNVLTSIGMGLPLHYDNITESSVVWCINELLLNPSYRLEAKKRQAIFQDRPMSPVDEAAYWIEYVLRHGKVLQPQSARMPFYQVYLIDVWATILSVFILVIFITRKVFQLLCRKRKVDPNSARMTKKVN